MHEPPPLVSETVPALVDPSSQVKLQVWVSAASASVKFATTLRGVPRATGALGPVTLPITGGTLLTAMLTLTLPVPPSLSVTLSVTAYVPLSLGMKVRLFPDPVAYGFPFFETVQE